MSKDSQLPTSDIELGEPTVLDLYKSIFKDWKSFFNFLVSAFDAARREQINHALAEKQGVMVEPLPEPVATPVRPGTAYSWRIFLGLALALLAQFMLEPPGKVIALDALQLEKGGRNTPIALGIYALALGLILWSILRRELALPCLLPDHERLDPE